MSRQSFWIIAVLCLTTLIATVSFSVRGTRDLDCIDDSRVVFFATENLSCGQTILPQHYRAERVPNSFMHGCVLVTDPSAFQNRAARCPIFKGEAFFHNRLIDFDQLYAPARRIKVGTIFPFR